MTLDITSDTAPLVRAGILYLHIGCGFIGMAAGGVAMVARKGEPVHRAAGNLFFVSMLIVAAIGAAIAPFLPRWISSAAGLLTFYLVATSWVTVKRREGKVGRFEPVALIFGVAVAGLALTLGLIGLSQPNGALNGEPHQAAFVFAGLATLAAIGDYRVIRRGGISGPSRIARHLWRMSTALLIAVLSFVAQPRAVPEAIRGSPFLYAPLIAVLIMMIYWLIRVRIPVRPAVGRA
jgi:uncharacterized membrane protein